MITKEQLSNLNSAIGTAGGAYNEDDKFNIGKQNDIATVTDGLFAIANSLDSVASALHNLGKANAATGMGAVEMLAKEVSNVADALGSSEE